MSISKDKIRSCLKFRDDLNAEGIFCDKIVMPSWTEFTSFFIVSRRKRKSCLSSLVCSGFKIIFTASVVFAYVGFILIFCVFRLASGSDPENALRYLMPASLALFYLGAHAYHGFIQRIEGMNYPPLGKYALIVAMIAVVMVRIF